MRDFGYQALIPSAISYKPKINSRTIQGERNVPGARHEGGTANSVTIIVREAQGGGRNGRARNGSTILARRPGHKAVPEYSRADLSAQGF